MTWTSVVVASFVVQLSTMISGALALVLFTLYICYCVKNAFERPPNFPPGPKRLPVYGSYWLILAADYNNLATAFTKLATWYKTKVVGCYLAQVPCVIINDLALIREMLHREEFDGRMDLLLGRVRSYWKRMGIFFTDGYFWHEQRRFSLRHLRDAGFGRRDAALEQALEEEIAEMIDMRLNGPRNAAEEEIVKGELVRVPLFLSAPFTNGMLHVFARQRLPRGDYHRLWDLSKAGLLFQRSSDDLGRALCMTPWLRSVAPVASGYDGLRKGHQPFLDMFEPMVSDAVSSHDESHDRHFIDTYLRRLKEELRTKERTTFSEEQLVLVLADYTFPAATALQTCVGMLLERCVLQPAVQRAAHAELDRAVGRARRVALDDRASLPYTEACIREMMRFDTLVPLGLPHRAMRDTALGGYHIPKDTAVSANYVPAHTDPAVWGDPEVFRPERFIRDGRLDVSLDKSLPFGAGRRLCAGETYARHAMFLVFANLLQAFELRPEGVRPAAPAPRRAGIITTLPDYWLRLVPRGPE